MKKGKREKRKREGRKENRIRREKSSLRICEMINKTERGRELKDKRKGDKGK